MEKENAIKQKPLISDFEKQYLEVRKREEQCYSNGQVALLPDIEATHPHHKEWQLRKRSCARLIIYLKKIKRPLKILEVGCGNGWLSSKLATIENVTVTGIDINTTELKQASAVFKNKDNLHFAYGDIHDAAFADQTFDIIVFAASISYFPLLAETLHAALYLLAPGGAIHIIDSPLYEDGKASLAKRRTKDYYDAMGLPGMTAFYFHHSLDELNAFRYKTLYDPFSIVNKLLQRHDPFYWISVFPLT